jgi:hypothetical protein
VAKSARFGKASDKQPWRTLQPDGFAAFSAIEAAVGVPDDTAG